jgi:hypothetical protein
MTVQETWVDDSTCKKIGLAEDFKEQKKKSKVSEFPEEQADKLEDFYDDDLVILTMKYTPGKFTVQDVELVDKVIQETSFDS